MYSDTSLLTHFLTLWQAHILTYSLTHSLTHCTSDITRGDVTRSPLITTKHLLSLSVVSAVHDPVSATSDAVVILLHPVRSSVVSAVHLLSEDTPTSVSLCTRFTFKWVSEWQCVERALSAVSCSLSHLTKCKWVSEVHARAIVTIVSSRTVWHSFNVKLSRPLQWVAIEWVSSSVCTLFDKSSERSERSEWVCEWENSSCRVYPFSTKWVRLLHHSLTWTICDTCMFLIHALTSSDTTLTHSLEWWVRYSNISVISYDKRWLSSTTSLTHRDLWKNHMSFDLLTRSFTRVRSR
jgi:hypothetical protein